MTDEEENKIAEAFEVIKQAMIGDNPSQEGSYAHAWHCNFVMACFDALSAELFCNALLSSKQKHKVANDAASRFMEITFDVKTKGTDDE